MKNKQINERLLLLLQTGEATNESRIRIPMSKYKSPANSAPSPSTHIPFLYRHTFAFLGEWAIGPGRRQVHVRKGVRAQGGGERKEIRRAEGNLFVAQKQKRFRFSCKMTETSVNGFGF